VEQETSKRGTRKHARRGSIKATKSEKEWDVEVILDSAVDAATKEHMYLVKWVGYPNSDNTWEPKRNLAKCLDLIKRFETKKAKAGRRKSVA
jgi:hypothetical protein